MTTKINIPNKIIAHHHVNIIAEFNLLYLII